MSGADALHGEQRIAVARMRAGAEALSRTSSAAVHPALRGPARVAPPPGLAAPCTAVFPRRGADALQGERRVPGAR
eukprot:14146805-Alexandrium_andersonii.AAC.1